MKYKFLKLILIIGLMSYGCAAKSDKYMDMSVDTGYNSSYSGGQVEAGIAAGLALDTDNDGSLTDEDPTFNSVTPGSVTIGPLSDPGDDYFLGWDDSDSAIEWFAPDDSTIEISTNTLQVKSGGIGSTQVGSMPYQKDITIPSPSASKSCLWFKARVAITITDIYAIIDSYDSGESISVDVVECASTGAGCVTVDAAITADNDGAEDDGSLSNGSIDANDWVGLTIGTPSGTISYLAVTIVYTEDK